MPSPEMSPGNLGLGGGVRNGLQQPGRLELLRGALAVTEFVNVDTIAQANWLILISSTIEWGVAAALLFRYGRLEIHDAARRDSRRILGLEAACGSPRPGRPP